ncbi:hypothetical protein KM1_261700 [Entamoeba histolytica HM-3:IMSS]|uniref:Single tm domain protein n=4 Tax=Entamoeba histolytica TaxID=5759 RepID=B1N3K0_ENTH1|nr:hypothetical protein EHI_095920 [Entamoeba histolytica HM-1:IMSS]EDS89459.1 hypothetical protein EHI_095920 [Entamoeba histolytica HM-1:IMSS]EMS12991.1 hypothetical protein KM1_261700 [Entamoeba histolytica HM-3:IMSS]ENY64481.1 hypothetical protein EHI7A_152220 [Entamoeba histolytica HM-1:IMSS-A]GAT95837.1 hypothetical protein CL6EHI_095920 [Entamoeba histolytica]|eukprot:XP_001913766.1 hypothetical protein EHI_095920 [Entamoeba histolytica HM-1:IMSS]
MKLICFIVLFTVVLSKEQLVIETVKGVNGEAAFFIGVEFNKYMCDDDTLVCNGEIKSLPNYIEFE